MHAYEADASGVDLDVALDVGGGQHALVAVGAVVREDAPVVVQVVLEALVRPEGLVALGAGVAFLVAHTHHPHDAVR